MEVKTRAMPLTESQKTEILRLYNLDIRNNSIAIIVGCSKPQVNRVLYKENPKIKNRNKVWTMNDFNEVKRLYIEKKYSCNRIARSMGISNRSVSDFLRRNGVNVNDWKKLRMAK